MAPPPKYNKVGSLYDIEPVNFSLTAYARRVDAVCWFFDRRLIQVPQWLTQQLMKILCLFFFSVYIFIPPLLVIFCSFCLIVFSFLCRSSFLSYCCLFTLLSSRCFCFGFHSFCFCFFYPFYFLRKKVKAFISEERRSDFYYDVFVHTSKPS